MGGTDLWASASLPLLATNWIEAVLWIVSVEDVDPMSDDCACLYGGCDDYDETGFQRAFMRTARKPHVCKECRRTIEPGQKYEYFSSKFEGSIFTIKTCAVCAEIRAALYCDGYYFGQLWKDIREQFFEQGGLSVKCVEKLETVAAKEELTRRYREFLGVA